jgi:GTP-binding protein Era
MLVHDVARAQIDADTMRILESIKQKQVKAGLILNKIDLTTPEHVMKRTSALSELYDFSKIFMVSAEKAKGTDDILAWLAEQMPDSPYLYDPDDLSDLPQRLLAAEIVREKLFLNLHEELPYQLTVETEQWVEREDGSAEVRCSIYVAREGHRGIILGQGGKTIGRIGKAARQELETMLDRRVHLFTHVKYRKNWLDDPARYRDWGLDFNA